MKSIELTYPHTLNKSTLPETIAAIGFFDGIHKGHHAVISQAIRRANELGKESAVISFHPHPSVILKQSKKRVKYITTLKEKQDILRNMGVDRFYIITFNEQLSKLPPEQFIDHFIVGLNITNLIAGFDYTFGHKGAGNMNNINEMAKGRFKTEIVEKLESTEEKISSTRIRNLLGEGKVDEIEPLLGRHYTTTGTVVKGDDRGGSQLGFPTANMEISADKLLPKQGVYAVKVRLKDKNFQGMANLGVVPTFIEDRQEPKLEVNIFDFNEQIYGEQLTVEWHAFIREEKKFSGIDDIVQQLHKDEKTIRKYFA